MRSPRSRLIPAASVKQLAMRIEQSLGLQFFGIPTELFFYLLGVMALGMAAFKSGLMTGELVQPGLCASGRNRSRTRSAAGRARCGHEPECRLGNDLLALFRAHAQHPCRAASRARLYCAGDPRCAPLRPRHAGDVPPRSGGWRFRTISPRASSAPPSSTGTGSACSCRSIVLGRSSSCSRSGSRCRSGRVPGWRGSASARRNWLWRSLVYRKVQPMLRHA